jgi:ADP-heptose:LPS heptosyltransferase
MAEKTSSVNLDPDTGSILLVRLKALGDIVLSIPLVNSIRRTFPNARIDYLCLKGYGEALKGVCDIDRVIEFKKGFTGQAALMLELRRTGYQLVVDLISSPRSAVITLSTGAGLRIGMDVGRHNFCYHKVLPRSINRNGRKVKYYTMDANREIARMLNLKPDRWSDSDNRYAIGLDSAGDGQEWADEFISEISGGEEGFIGIVPAAKYQAKRWPAEKFVEFISLLMERTGYIPVLLWGPGEERMVDYILKRSPGAVKLPLVGISPLAAMIARMDCLVGVDSGPKHLAVMQGVPTVTLFGPTDPEIWDPMTDDHLVVRKELHCSPCGRTECSSPECMNGITAQEFFDKVKVMLDRI